MLALPFKVIDVQAHINTLVFPSDPTDAELHGRDHRSITLVLAHAAKQSRHEAILSV